MITHLFPLTVQIFDFPFRSIILLLLHVTRLKRFASIVSTKTLTILFHVYVGKRLLNVLFASRLTCLSP